MTTLDDQQYRRLMSQAGMPHSKTLRQILEHCAVLAAMEEREACAKLAEQSGSAEEAVRRIRER